MNFLVAFWMMPAAPIERREDQLRWKTHDIRTRVTECTGVDGEIFEHLL